MKRFYYFFFENVENVLSSPICLCDQYSHSSLLPPTIHESLQIPTHLFLLFFLKSCLLSTYHLLSTHLSLNRRLAGVNTFIILTVHTQSKTEDRVNAFLFRKYCLFPYKQYSETISQTGKQPNF